MPRETRKQLSTNATGRTDINVAPAGVYANPVDTTVLPETSGLTKLAGALREASPQFNAYLQKRESEFIDAEVKRGERDALRDGTLKEQLDQQIAAGMLPREASPWYRKAYMKQMGVNAGYLKAQELLTKYETAFDKDAGDLNGFLGQELTAILQSSDDDDFAEGMFPAIKEAEAKIRAAQAGYTAEALQSGARDQTFTAIGNAFRKALEASRSSGQPFDFHPENFTVLEANARELGIDRKEFNKLVFDAAMQVGTEGQGNPELFAALKREGINGPASMYFTQEYGQDLQRAEELALKAREVATQDARDAQKFELMQGFEERIKRGKPPTNAELKQLVASGTLSPSEASSIANSRDAHAKAAIDREKDLTYIKRWFEMSQQARLGKLTNEQILADPVLKDSDKKSLLGDNLSATEFNAKVGAATAAVMAGDIHALHTIRNGKDGAKVIDTTKDTLAGQRLGFAQQDPSKLPMAISGIVNDARADDGKLAPQFKSAINMVPANGDKAMEVLQMRKAVESADATVLQKNTDTDTDTFYRNFDRFTQTGYSPQAAYEKAQELSNPTKRKEREALLDQTDYRNARLEGYQTFIEDNGLTDNPQARADYAAKFDAVVASGLTDPEQAAKVAATSMASRFTKREFAGVPVTLDPRVASKIHPEFDAASAWLIETYAKENPGAIPEGSRFDADATFLRDPSKGLVVVDEAGVPVLKDGVPLRVNPDKAVEEWKYGTGQWKTPEQVVQENAAKQAERAREQARKSKREAQSKAYHDALDRSFIGTK